MVEVPPFREKSCILEPVYITTVMNMEAVHVELVGVRYGWSFKEWSIPFVVAVVRKESW
jgi:hypothetical protein